MSVGGTLVREPKYGLGLQQKDGTVRGVLWPYGWSARLDTTGIVLIDEIGRPVANEGSYVTFDGYSVGDHDVVVGR
jgi:hypothetical protein